MESLLSPYVLGAIVLLVAAIAGVGYAALTFLNPTRTTSDRLRDMTGVEDSDGSKKRDEAVERVAARLSALANPEDEDQRKQLKLRMVQAGFTARHALDIYGAARIVLVFLLPIIFVIVPIIVVPDAMAERSTTTLLALTVLSAAIGYYAPSGVINNRIETRQKLLLNAFPDAMDLLVSSVEAGLGLDAAFRRVAEEIEGAAPELSREFRLVNHEIAAGIPRLEALKHLHDRSGLEEIGGMVNMLTQAERFGTSIARSLRTHANGTRQKRMFKAEQAAARLSPKITVVMILFLLPCLFITIMGPACIQISTKFLTL